MKEAYFIENAFWQSPATRLLKASLTAAAAGAGIRLIPRTNADFPDECHADEAPRYGLFWDKDVRLAQMLEGRGFRLLNNANAIRLCDDKTLTFLALRPHGIPVPKTLLCPLTYPKVGYTHTDFLIRVQQELSLPFVIKEGMGSFGQQVFLAHTLEEAASILRQCAGAPILFQQFVSESAGRDIRLYVVGNRVVAAMMRVNTAGDFRANIAGGGHALAFTPSDAQTSLAVEACRLLGLDFGGVDLLLGRDGPLLCEVNSNAHFGALRELTGINPAEHIAARLKEAMG